MSALLRRIAIVTAALAFLLGLVTPVSSGYTGVATGATLSLAPAMSADDDPAPEDVADAVECVGSAATCSLDDAGEWLGGQAADTLNDVAAAGVSSVFDQLKEHLAEAAVDALTSLGTVWVDIETPTVYGPGKSSQLQSQDQADLSGLNKVLGYSIWITLAICLLSLMVAGVRLARSRSDELDESAKPVGMVLIATILASGAFSIIQLYVRHGRTSEAIGTAQFLERSLLPFVAASACVGILVAAARMAWEQRAEPGKDLVGALIRLGVVAGAGATIVGLLAAAGDKYSVWIVNKSLNECDVSSNGECFAERVGGMLGLVANSEDGNTLQGETMALFLVIIFALVALVTALTQIMLMVARSAMLVLLVGALPLAASASNTEVGRAWFKRFAAWLGAFLLYKPAAATIYATAFSLTADDQIFADRNSLLAPAAGLMLMVLAIVALPALMRVLAPAVDAVAGSGGGGGALAGAGAGVATGAIYATSMMSGGGSGSSGGRSGSPSPAGAGGTPTSGGGPNGASGATAAAGAAKAHPAAAAAAGAAQKSKDLVNSGISQSVGGVAGGATHSGSDQPHHAGGSQPGSQTGGQTGGARGAVNNGKGDRA